MLPFNITDENNGDAQGVIAAGVTHMAKLSCNGTNGTVVDYLDEAICSLYLFHSTKYLANTSFSACTSAEHATGPLLCSAKSENICAAGDSCSSCSADDSTWYSIYIPVWFRTCTWQEGSPTPPLCNSPLAVGQTMNGTCSGPEFGRRCKIVSIEPSTPTVE